MKCLNFFALLISATILSQTVFAKTVVLNCRALEKNASFPSVQLIVNKVVKPELGSEEVFDFSQKQNITFIWDDSQNGFFGGHKQEQLVFRMLPVSYSARIFRPSLLFSVSDVGTDVAMTLTVSYDLDKSEVVANAELISEETNSISVYRCK